jgi:tRNA U55 pseudouridine synthase TruB
MALRRPRGTKRPVTTSPDPLIHGVLPVDKPAGPTSHDVVALARRALRTRRIGHTGTLDPFATGLLLLCVGHATRIAEYLSGHGQAIQCHGAAGCRDGHGRQYRNDHGPSGQSAITYGARGTALAPLRGAVLQTPPQYSAKKRDGERAYTAARQGREVSLRTSARSHSRTQPRITRAARRRARGAVFERYLHPLDRARSRCGPRCRRSPDQRCAGLRSARIR